MKIKPIFDRIVIEQFDAKEKTDSGILLPTSTQERPQLATVIAVGTGGLVDGKQTEMVVKVGDKILYSKFAGIEYDFGDKKYTIIRQGDVLGILE